nr:MAG TPA: RNA polymerase sigma factor [Caudoviricetes sp.]
MRRNYCSDYVNHCLRFYAKYPKPFFRHKIDKMNWDACDKAVSELTLAEKKIIVKVYQADVDDFPRLIREVARIHNVPTQDVWDLIASVENKVAKYRELSYKELNRG